MYALAAFRAIFVALFWLDSLHFVLSCSFLHGRLVLILLVSFLQTQEPSSTLDDHDATTVMMQEGTTTMRQIDEEIMMMKQVCQHCTSIQHIQFRAMCVAGWRAHARLVLILSLIVPFIEAVVDAIADLIVNIVVDFAFVAGAVALAYIVAFCTCFNWCRF